MTNQIITALPVITLALAGLLSIYIGLYAGGIVLMALAILLCALYIVMGFDTPLTRLVERLVFKDCQHD